MLPHWVFLILGLWAGRCSAVVLSQFLTSGSYFLTPHANGASWVNVTGCVSVAVTASNVFTYTSATSNTTCTDTWVFGPLLAGPHNVTEVCTGGTVAGTNGNRQHVATVVAGTGSAAGTFSIVYQQTDAATLAVCSKSNAVCALPVLLTFYSGGCPTWNTAALIGTWLGDSGAASRDSVLSVGQLPPGPCWPCFFPPIRFVSSSWPF